MSEILSAERIRQLRLHALGLAGTSAPSPGDQGAAGAQRAAAEVARLGAIQGQDWAGSQQALAVRIPDLSAADIRGAFEQHLIVRSWPMRGTVHLVPAADIGWMQQVTNKRVVATAPRRREFLGSSDQVLEQLIEVSMQALRGSTGLTREQLAQAWTDAGIAWQGNWRYHLIWWMSQNGLTVFGPFGERGEPLLVRADEWIPTPRWLEDDEALAELAARHIGGRGPASEKDLAWWLGIGVTQARRGIALAADAGRITHTGDSEAGVKLWARPGLADEAVRDTSGDWLLLPAFDEHLLGYTERAAHLDPDHFIRIVPGRNGMFQATVVHGGRVVGTWKRAKDGFTLSPMPGEKLDLTALQPAADRLAAFTGGATTLQLMRE